jgi:hypothetical protein
MQSALKLPIGLPVRIDPITLDLYNRDQPGNSTFAKLYLPGTTIKGNTTMGVTNQFTPLNVDQWTKYVHNVVFMAHGPLSLKGTTTSYLGKLKSRVTMDKTIKQNSKHRPRWETKSAANLLSSKQLRRVFHRELAIASACRTRRYQPARQRHFAQPLGHDN